MFLGAIVRDVRRALRRLFLVGAAVVLLGTAGNQVLDRGFVYSNIGTLFSWSGTAQAWSGSHQAVTYQDFTAYLNNNGSCIPAGLTNAALIDYSHATGCAQNATTVNATTDPFLINGAASWTQSGGAFGLLAGSSVPGQPTGAQSFTASTGSSNTSTITQAITPNVNASTKLVARAYLHSDQATQSGDATNCGDTINTYHGTATIEIKDPSGTVVASQSVSSGATGYAQFTATLNSAGSSGTYTIVGAVTNTAVTYTFHSWNGSSCTPHTTTLNADADITDLTIGNS